MPGVGALGVTAGRAPTPSRPPPQACAPLQHWNAVRGHREAFRTPVGACYVSGAGRRGLAWISPCRDVRMAASYRETQYGERGAGRPPPEREAEGRPESGS